LPTPSSSPRSSRLPGCSPVCRRGRCATARMPRRGGWRRSAGSSDQVPRPDRRSPSPNAKVDVVTDNSYDRNRGRRSVLGSMERMMSGTFSSPSRLPRPRRARHEALYRCLGLAVSGPRPRLDRGAASRPNVLSALCQQTPSKPAIWGWTQWTPPCLRARPVPPEWHSQRGDTGSNPVGAASLTSLLRGAVIPPAYPATRSQLVPGRDDAAPPVTCPPRRARHRQPGPRPSSADGRRRARRTRA